MDKGERDRAEIKSLLDRLLEGKDDKFKSIILEMVISQGWDKNDPAFLIGVATNQLEAILKLQPDLIDAIFERNLKKVNKSHQDEQTARLAHEDKLGKIRDSFKTIGEGFSTGIVNNTQKIIDDVDSAATKIDTAVQDIGSFQESALNDTKTMLKIVANLRSDCTEQATKFISSGRELNNTLSSTVRMAHLANAFTIYGAVVTLGLNGVIWLLIGNSTLANFLNHNITNETYWSETRWSMVACFVIPSLVFFGYFIYKEDRYEWDKLGLISILLGIGYSLVMFLQYFRLLPNLV
jgi:hypothetical protein